MKKVLSIILILFLLGFEVMAEDMIFGTMYIDDIKIENYDTVVFSGYVMLPLRTMFEGLGASVVWDEQTRKVEILYGDLKYLCEMVAPNPKFPEIKYIYIRDTSVPVDDRIYQDIELLGLSLDDSLFNCIQLNPTGSEGYYEMINNRIYISQETTRYLLNNIGYSLTVNYEESSVNIFKITE